MVLRMHNQLPQSSSCIATFKAFWIASTNYQLHYHGWLWHLHCNLCHTSRPIASVCSVSTHQRSPRPKQLVTTIIATSPAKHQVQQICIWILFSGVMLKPQPNPMIPQCYLHLQINGQVIAHDLQASLCSAALTPECHTYMQKKLK